MGRRHSLTMFLNRVIDLRLSVFISIVLRLVHRTSASDAKPSCHIISHSATNQVRNRGRRKLASVLRAKFPRHLGPKGLFPEAQMRCEARGSHRTTA